MATYQMRNGTDIDNEQLQADIEALAEEFSDEVVIREVSVEQKAVAEEPEQVVLSFTMVPSTDSTFSGYTLPYND